MAGNILSAGNAGGSIVSTGRRSDRHAQPCTTQPVPAQYHPFQLPSRPALQGTRGSPGRRTRAAGVQRLHSQLVQPLAWGCDQPTAPSLSASPYVARDAEFHTLTSCLGQGFRVFSLRVRAMANEGALKFVRAARRSLY